MWDSMKRSALTTSVLGMHTICLEEICVQREVFTPSAFSFPVSLAAAHVTWQS